MPPSCMNFSSKSFFFSLWDVYRFNMSPFVETRRSLIHIDFFPLISSVLRISFLAPTPQAFGLQHWGNSIPLSSLQVLWWQVINLDNSPRLCHWPGWHADRSLPVLEGVGLSVGTSERCHPTSRLALVPTQEVPSYAPIGSVQWLLSSSSGPTGQRWI